MIVRVMFFFDTDYKIQFDKIKVKASKPAF